ncbi:MAG: hypothetical protein IKP55_00490 [Clostridia bacterium]|nr:hypothetical protein [Clostridia bacterium]
MATTAVLRSRKPRTICFSGLTISSTSARRISSSVSSRSGTAALLAPKKVREIQP